MKITIIRAIQYFYHNSSQLTDYFSFYSVYSSYDSFSDFSQVFFSYFLVGLGLAFNWKYLSFANSAYLIMSLFWYTASSLISVYYIDVKISLIFFSVSYIADFNSYTSSSVIHYLPFLILSVRFLCSLTIANALSLICSL